MKTIIRFEMPNGIGIFNNTEFTPYSVIDRHRKFPTIWQDNGFENIGVIITKDYFCAYKTIEQVQQWIMKDEIISLINNGCNILMLDVSEFIEGEFQTIYKKEHIVSNKIINSLFL